MCKINIRERFLWGERAAANNYKCDTSSIDAVLVETNDNENIFTHDDGYNPIPEMFRDISLPIITKPIIENGNITHIDLLVAGDHDDSTEVFETVNSFIKDASIRKDPNTNILTLVYSDTIFIHSFHYLFELEIED